jgi:hypothetical protein
MGIPVLNNMLNFQSNLNIALDCACYASSKTAFSALKHSSSPNTLKETLNNNVKIICKELRNKLNR